MKSSVLIGGLLVIIALVVIGLLLMRSPATEPTSTVSLEEEEGQPNQFIAQIPETSSEVTTPLVSPTASPSDDSDATEKSIVISDTSFTPSTLTIPVNTTVIFTNNGQGAHWPASDAHPTHTQLPGFDAKHGLATGESYSYTFAQKGTWKYHDHLNPRITGTVIVQ